MPDQPESYWEASAKPLAPVAPLTGDTTADTLVIGAGYTGLNAGLELIEHGVDAVVIDAQEIGKGASGRSGGFIGGRFRMPPAKVLRRYGQGMVDIMQRISLESSAQVEENASRYNLDGAQYRRHGSIRAAFNDHQLAVLKAGFGAVKTDFGDATKLRLLDRNEIAELTGSDRFVGGTISPDLPGVHPLGYTRGLAAAYLGAGGRLYGSTPALRLSRAGAAFRVDTPTGSIRAGQVILATNAYSGLTPAVPEMARRIAPFRSAAIATAPLPDDLLRKLLPGGQMMFDCKRILRWYRMMENRVIIGGRGAGNPAQDDWAYARLRRNLYEVYPVLADIPVDYRWSGYVGMTMDLIPHVGRLSEGLVVAGGYNGNGVAFASLFGRYAARIALGQRIELGIVGTDHFRRMPVHQLSQPAVRLVARWHHLMDAIGR